MLEVNIHGLSNLINSLIRVAKLQNMTNSETSIMIKDFLKTIDIEVPESFIKTNKQSNEVEKVETTKSSVIEFLNQKQIQKEHKSNKFKVDVLYKDFKIWSLENGNYPLSKSNFISELTTLGFKRTQLRENGVRSYYFIKE